MGLTQVSTDGVKNDAITKTKIPANQIEASELADNAVDTNAIADQAVALSKLPHGDGSSDGKFLRSNNGADPSFETVSIPAGTTINNNGSTRIITGTDNANELDAETNLTVNGSTITFAESTLNVNKGTSPTIGVKETTGNKEAQFRADTTGGLLRTVGSYPLVLGTNQAERMRITSTGRVGIGTTSPGHIFTVTDASSSIGFSRSGNNPQIIFDSNNVGAAAMFQVSESSGGAYLQMYTKDTSGNLDECIRVDPDQKVMMGSISSPANSGILTLRGETNHLTCQSIHTGGYYSIYFRSANTNVGNIFFNSGGVQFNTSSDYRRKENVVSLTGAIDRVKTLSPKRFNFISEPSVIRDGFLAHEVTAVPEAITGEKDAVETTYYEEGDTIPDGKAIGDVKSTTSPVYQCIDQSKLVPLLTAALQEAITKIETLETKVAALEAA